MSFTTSLCFHLRLVMTELATTERDYVEKLRYCIEVCTHIYTLCMCVCILAKCITVLLSTCT